MPYFLGMLRLILLERVHPRFHANFIDVCELRALDIDKDSTFDTHSSASSSPFLSSKASSAAAVLLQALRECVDPK